MSDQDHKLAAAYNRVARERDLLADGVQVAHKELRRMRCHMDYPGSATDRFEAKEAWRRAMRALSFFDFEL